MRALPLIERGLLGAMALVLVVLLVFLLVWHVRWRRMLDPARAGALVPSAVAVTPADVAADFQVWCRAVDAAKPEPETLAVPLQFLAYRKWHEALAERNISGAKPVLSRAMRDRLARLIARGLRLDGWGRMPPVWEDWEVKDDHEPGSRGVEAVVAGLVVDAVEPSRSAIALARCDTLLAAMTPPRSFNAFMNWCYVCEVRDDAYVLAALAGTASPEALARWRVTPVDPPAMLVEKIEGERWSRRQRTADLFAAGPLALAPAHGMAPDWRSARDLAPEWWGLPDTCERDDAAAAAYQTQISARGAPFVTNATFPGMFDFDVILPQMAVHAGLRHRLALLAVQVLRLRDAHGKLPARIDGLDLAAGQDRVALAITSTARSFTIVADPAAPMAPYIAADYATEAEQAWNGMRLDPRGVAMDFDQMQVGDVLHSGLPSATTAGTAAGGAVAP